MKPYTFVVTTLGALLLAPTYASAQETILDEAENAMESLAEFESSSCGDAVKTCWTSVKEAIGKADPVCKAFRTCKSKCRVAKRSDKKECFDSKCTGLKGKAKKECKQNCRKGSRMAKRSCVEACGARPASCGQAWKRVADGIRKCGAAVSDSDCSEWANKIAEMVQNAS